MTLSTIACIWIAGLLAVWGFYGLLVMIRTADEARAKRNEPDPIEHFHEGWQ
ncbi:hypothetical protein [Labrys neptuniae]